MDRLKTNYIIFNSILITAFTLTLLLLNYFGFITTKVLPITLIVAPYIGLILYLSEKKTKVGYFFSTRGITVKNKKNEFFTPWDEVKLIKVSTKFKIQLSNNESISPFNIFNEESIIALTLKYCPKDHELYKLVEEYQKK